MRKFTQWFFIIGSFVFLYWYMPEALSDKKVTLGEMAFIGINVLSFIVNFANFVSARFESGLTQRALDGAYCDCQIYVPSYESTVAKCAVCGKPPRQ